MPDQNDNRSNVKVAIIDLIRGALWPIVALLVMFYFTTPIGSILNALSANLRSASTIDLGGYVKLTVKDANVEAPTADVGNVLTKLNTSLLKDLFDHPNDTGLPICSDPSIPTYQDKEADYNKLQSLDIIRFAPAPNQDWCKGPVRYAYLTQKGRATRDYLTDLISSTLKISKS